MRISTVEALPVSVPMQHPFGGRTTVSVVVARVRTDDGLEGLGQAMMLTLRHFGSLVRTLEELAELIVGEDPRDTERIYRKLSPGGSWSGSGSVPNQATAALDVAIWDIAGKAAGLPLYKLLGGSRDRVRAYATTRLGRNLPITELVETAAALVKDEGFRAIKMNVAGHPSVAAEVERVRAVREAIGPNVDLMADANGLWSPAQAIRVGRAIEEYQLFWLEDVVPTHNVAGLTEVCRALDTPVATGETLFGFTAFLPLFEARAVDVPMPDLMRVGGITPFMKVAHMAEAFGLPVANHLIHEVSAHLVAAVPNGLVAEYVPWSSQVFTGCPELRDGDLVLSDRPGHGLQLDEEFVAKHRIN
jgi:L-alanine-DL-glutamate epimerase-like enolase superfamily enzyme